MFQGTGSDVGKSLLVAGLARAFTVRGLRVRPFKPQNMSNNAAVTSDGGEIGRAQALQARAAGVPATTDMNPVLLKPQSEIGAQVIVQGRVAGNASARDYHALKPTLLPRVLESFDRLRAEADLVLVEGAGSPAEINLRVGDIANMGFALAARVPVVLVGDIDRGGVIASLVGTLAVLAPEEQAAIRGFIVNKFRGDAALFAEGRRLIAARTGLADLGLVPWFDGARRLPAEDAAGLDSSSFGADSRNAEPRLKIAVPRLPRISNFDDLDPLKAEPDVELVLVPPGEALPGDADAVILPGSKATIPDLAALRDVGWDIDIAAHVRRGGHVLGLCGGYQMLGRAVLDPERRESAVTRAEGLGLLDVTTVLAGDKTLRESKGSDIRSRSPVQGYEIHLGDTDGPATLRPMLKLETRDDGAVSPDGRIEGCYLHGLFGSGAFRRTWLDRLRARRGLGGGAATPDWDATVDATLDALA
ncbi:MAG: cobyric acid synthase, partial [Alphaproteobacteria bacterium]|nr:cobyric acid synthase [Alphaproteobacteria bacterium]